MRKTIQSILLSLIVALLCYACDNKPATDGRLYHVGVMHSLDSLTECYKEFDETLAEEFQKAGLNVELHNFYLNMEEVNFDSVKIKENLALYDEIGIDLFITEGDFGANNALTVRKLWPTKRINILCGVTNPDWDMIRHDTLLYAWYSMPNYRRIAMDAARITKSRRLLIELDYGVRDSILRRNLHQAFQTSPFIDNIDLVKPIPLTRAEIDKVCADSIMMLSVSYEYTDSNYIRSLGRDQSAYETMRQLVSIGFDDAQIQVKCDRFSNEPILRSGRPQITCLPYGFGERKRYLMGYFTPMDEQARDVASTAVRLLRGERPGIMMFNLHQSHAYMDYETMTSLGMHYRDYEDEFDIINAPVLVSHSIMSRLLMVAFILLATLCLHFIGVILFRRKSQSANRYNQSINIASLPLIGREYLSIRSLDGVVMEINRGREDSFEHAIRLTMDDFAMMMHPDFVVQRRRFVASMDVAGKYFANVKLSFDDGHNYSWWCLRYVVSGDSDSHSMIGMLINIEKEKQRELDYTNAMEEVENQRGKEDFLNRMNHEVRTPLNAVVGMCHLLADESIKLTDEERKSLQKKMKRSSDQLTDLVQDILTYSRIGSGRLRFTMQPVLVDEIMDFLADIYTTRFAQPELYDENDINKAGLLTFRYIKGAAGLMIKVDSEFTRLLFKHLMTNAIKFTDKGEINIGWFYHHKTNEVELYVQDNGKGIAPERQDNLWKPFYKQDSYHAGLGLGLSIVHSLASSMDARLEIHCRPGRG